MRLGELIKALAQLPQDATVAHGFGSPHSYRGDYSQLAFSPIEDAPVADMLAYARCAIGETFTGRKGGDYLMDESTECHIAEPSELGDEITASRIDCWRLEIELAAKSKALDEALAKATAPKLVARRPDEVPEGWSGIARVNFGNSSPILLVALAKRSEFVRINDQANEVSATHIEACFDFPIADAMTAQPPRAIPPLATGQHWRTPGGASITIGCAVSGRAGFDKFQYLELTESGAGVWQGEGKAGSIASRIEAGGFELVAGPGVEVRA